MWQGPFGIIVEMLLAMGEEGAELARQLAKFTWNSREIPANWKESLIQNHYRHSRKSLHCCKYRGLNLPNQVMKLLEQVLDWYHLNGLQLQAKYITANKQLYVAFVDFDKAHDRVPRKVLWTLMGFSVYKWAVCQPEDVLPCPQLCASLWSIQKKVFCGSSCESWLCPSSSTLHPITGNAFVWVPHQSTTGNFLCGAHCGNPGGVYLPAQGMEGWHVK